MNNMPLYINDPMWVTAATIFFLVGVYLGLKLWKALWALYKRETKMPPVRHLTQGEVNVMDRALRRSTRLIHEGGPSPPHDPK